MYNESGDLNFFAASSQQNSLFFEEALRFTIGELNAAGKTVVVVLPTPEYEYHVPNLLGKLALFGASTTAHELEIEDYNNRNLEVRDILYDVGNDFHVKFVDPKTIYCGVVSCSVSTIDGYPLYEDSNHLSYFGSLPLVDEMLDTIKD